MQRRWNISATILFVALPVCQASEPPPLSMLALPKIELRKEKEFSGAAAENQMGSENSSEDTEELTLSAKRIAAESETRVRVFETMNGSPLLSQVEQRETPSGAFGWVETQIWDPVFAPEVVKFGKVKMSGGIVAAIKRKNPFCLLNPLAFVASW
jgi:hypothetical protein